MANRIKVINTQIIFDLLCESKIYSEDEVSQKVSDMENQEKFKAMFFHHDEAIDLYYYQESNEQAIKEYMSKHVDISVLNDEEVFKDLGQDLWDWRNNDYIEIETHIGTLSIKDDNFYAAMDEVVLDDEKVIERLVSADDFDKEFGKVEQECFLYLVDRHMEIVRENINNNFNRVMKREV